MVQRGTVARASSSLDEERTSGELADLVRRMMADYRARLAAEDAARERARTEEEAERGRDEATAA